MLDIFTVKMRCSITVLPTRISFLVRPDSDRKGGEVPFDRWPTTNMPLVKFTRKAKFVFSTDESKFALRRLNWRCPVDVERRVSGHRMKTSRCLEIGVKSVFATSKIATANCNLL